MRNLSELAQRVKESVSALDEGRLMGLNIDRAGFCRCPFHQEKTASLKLYKGQRGYHCFGCGATGDVINLVMRYYDISFKQALLRLDSEWGLGLNLTGRPLSRRERKAEELKAWHRALRKSNEERLQQIALEAYYSACKLADEFLRQKAENAPTGPSEGWNEAFCQALQYSAEVRELAEELVLMAIGGEDE